MIKDESTFFLVTFFNILKNLALIKYYESFLVKF